MTPIEKNIIVVDELGNEYEATYPKRAKGLVKNGRARFIDDNKICLACPPHTELEDNNMSEKKNVSKNIPEDMGEMGNIGDIGDMGDMGDIGDIGDMGDMGDIGDIGNIGDMGDIEEKKSKSDDPKQSGLTMEYVLGKIDAIANDTFHIHEAIDTISRIKSTGPGDVGTQEQTKAIGDIVRARETTNQRLIAFYEKLYDDLKPQNVIPSERMLIIQSLIETLGDGITPIEAKEALESILGTALQDLTRNI